MKKHLGYIALIVTTLLMSSCEKWLDVEMKTNVKSEKLLTTEQGFKDALIGVYSNMIGEELYGRQLSYGFFETLVSNYDLNNANQSVYMYVAEGKLSSTNVRSITDGFWNGLYNVIANINNITDQIDAKKSVFTGDNYNIIKGEALGLRAFLHLEIFKIFGDFSNLEANAIPYVDQLTNSPIASIPGDQLFARIQADLKQAETLLEKDPVRSGNPTTSDVFLNNRTLRMNYYAVRALEARSALWSGDKTSAYTLATSLMTECAQAITWINSENMTGSDEKKCDYSLSSEQFFSLDVYNLKSLYDYWLGKEALSANIFSKGFYYFERWYQKSGVGASDYRFLYMTEKGTVAATQNYIAKRYYQPEGYAKYSPAYANRIPLLRLSELYYIAAECRVGVDNEQACKWLNEVRRHRGITTDLSGLDNENTLKEIRSEYLKEFWSEGQFFFLCKRHNYVPSDRYSKFNLRTAFTIERPDLETEYNK